MKQSHSSDGHGGRGGRGRQGGRASGRKHRGKPRAVHASDTGGATPAARKKGGKRRGRGGAGASHRQSKLTSHPTSRNALMETREWLLHRHGPTCAYCGRTSTAREMTLDHVAPRRGQTAYDRRDNLVLACKTCNAAKRDLAPLAFLLGLRSRAANLVRYGAHLSAGLVELARSLLPDGHVDEPPPHSGRRHRTRWNETISDDDSPYKA